MKSVDGVVPINDVLCHCNHQSLVFMLTHEADEDDVTQRYTTTPKLGIGQQCSQPRDANTIRFEQ